MRCGSAPWRIRLATRCASVLVLPEPAPAITSSARCVVRQVAGAVPHRLELLRIELGERIALGLAWTGGRHELGCRWLYINPVDNILVGTASWTDKTLIDCGRFYPEGGEERRGPAALLRDAVPAMVEVDSSYYGMPTPVNAQLWAERTPPGFVFNVKAFRLFTGHQTSPVVLHKDLQQALGPNAPKMLYYRDTPAEIRDELWKRFIEALAPLQRCRQARRRALPVRAVDAAQPRGTWPMCGTASERMPGHLLAVEFRNKSWFDGDQLDGRIAFERELGVVHTIVDSPQGFANCVPCVWEVTQSRARDRAAARPQRADLEHQGRHQRLEPFRLLVFEGRAGGDGA